MGVLSDWIRPALKPLDTTVPIVNVSANVLPYGAPIFNNDDMVILQPHAVLPGVVYPTRYSQGQFIQFVYFSTGSWPHPARIWHWIPQSSVRSLLILLLPGTKPMVSDKDALFFLETSFRYFSMASTWLHRFDHGCAIDANNLFRYSEGFSSCGCHSTCWRTKLRRKRSQCY